MRIIYSCYGGAHSSPVAAAIHLRRIPRSQPPTNQQLMRLDLFDRTRREQHGILMHMGVDDWGNDVYVFGRGPSGSSMERALLSGMRLAGASTHDVKFVDTLPAVNWWMRIGGLLSRALGLTAVGRPLVLFGTRLAFPRLVELVEEVERNLADGWNTPLGAADREAANTPVQAGKETT